MDEDRLREEALEYHAAEPAGKIRIVPTKPHGTARELSLAYSPGVAYPCEEIAENPDDAYKYTSNCLLYTSPSPRDLSTSRMPSSA